VGTSGDPAGGRRGPDLQLPLPLLAEAMLNHRWRRRSSTPSASASSSGSRYCRRRRSRPPPLQARPRRWAAVIRAGHQAQQM
jgi:hypothetical protein